MDPDSVSKLITFFMKVTKKYIRQVFTKRLITGRAVSVDRQVNTT